MSRTYEQLEYTPYGELWVEHVPVVEATPFRFTGKERDSETGLYYYGARYLNPQTGLWLSADPAMGEYVPHGLGGIYNTINFHSFAYAGNNPVRYTDPDGRDLNDLTPKSSPASVRREGGRNFDSQSRMTPRQIARADQKAINKKPRIEVQRSPSDVRASEVGTVSSSGWQNPDNHAQGFGWYTRIERADGSREYFAHLDPESTLPVGTQVNAGDVVSARVTDTIGVCFDTTGGPKVTFLDANTNKLGLSKDVGTRGPGKITLGGRVNDF
jgi:RHS repeat-associated protein